MSRSSARLFPIALQKNVSSPQSSQSLLRFSINLKKDNKQTQCVVRIPNESKLSEWNFPTRFSFDPFPQLAPVGHMRGYSYGTIVEAGPIKDPSETIVWHTLPTSDEKMKAFLEKYFTLGDNGLIINNELINSTDREEINLRKTLQEPNGFIYAIFKEGGLEIQGLNPFNKKLLNNEEKPLEQEFRFRPF